MCVLPMGGAGGSGTACGAACRGCLLCCAALVGAAQRCPPVICSAVTRYGPAGPDYVGTASCFFFKAIIRALMSHGNNKQKRRTVRAESRVRVRTAPRQAPALFHQALPSCFFSHSHALRVCPITYGKERWTRVHGSAFFSSCWAGGGRRKLRALVTNDGAGTGLQRPPPPTPFFLALRERASMAPLGVDCYHHHHHHLQPTTSLPVAMAVATLVLSDVGNVLTFFVVLSYVPIFVCAASTL